MPQRAPRRCTASGCPRLPLAGETRCKRHRSARPRPSAAAQGYGVEHRERFRAAVLARDPVCRLCDRRPSVVADHYPRSRRELVELGMDPNDPHHGRGLCRRCDSKQTSERQPGGWNANY